MQRQERARRSGEWRCCRQGCQRLCDADSRTLFFRSSHALPDSVVLQGHSCNLYREAAQRFSEASKKLLALRFHQGNQDTLNGAKALTKKRRTGGHDLHHDGRGSAGQAMGAVSSTGLEKRIKSWLSSVSSQDKKPVSMLSLASKQKCDLAAHAVAVFTRRSFRMRWRRRDGSG